MSRLAMCLDLMERDGIDALLLGREANARTVSDASRLWLAGTRVFSPGCVVVRRSGAVHVLANTDAVVPIGFPVSRLYGLTWNPEKLIAALTAIDGLHAAQRVAVDGMTPMASALIARVAPEAEVVDAGPLFAHLWTVPEGAKAGGVERAAHAAAAALSAMADALRPGVRPERLRGIAAATLARHGATTPAFEAVAATLAPDASTWLPCDRAFNAGERVVLRAGVLQEGWEASLARTYLVAEPGAAPLSPAGWDALVAATVPGVRVDALRDFGATIWGAGRGIEAWPDELLLVSGLMVALELRDATALRQDVVRVTDHAPVLVTNASGE